MDRYELNVSMDEIDRLISERNFKEAASLADKIDWTRVRSTYMLCKISDLYKINKRYTDSRDLMAVAYERNPMSRKIIYSLCELELKLNNYIHALQLYNAFINVAPRDPDRYLLQYKLYKKQDVNVHEQIAVLEEFLQRDFRERWAYELATLYLRAEDPQRCISQCDEIVAYFGDGRFVVRALELKKSLTDLTPQQEERLEILRSGGTIPEAASKEETPEPVSSAEETGAASAAEETEPGLSREEPAGLNPLPADPVSGPGAQEGTPGKDLAGVSQDTDGRLSSVEDLRTAAEESVKTGADRESVQPADEENERTEQTEDGAEEYSDALLRGANQQMRDQNMQETIARGMREIDGYEDVLAQETSGQLAMVMEEDPAEESQVEGQLNIEQIMSEWEKIRRDSEQQRLAEARRRVMETSSAAKRQLYGDDFVNEEYAKPAGGDSAEDPAEAAAGSASESAADDERETENTGTTRSWKREDVEKGLRGKDGGARRK